MNRILFLIAAVFLLNSGLCRSQVFIKTADLFKREDGHSGQLNLLQDKSVDTLLSRHILANSKIRTEGQQGMHGFRIQIYYSSVRNAREESAKTQAKFIEKFPEIPSYPDYQEPGWFIVRVGDYRSIIECYKDLMKIRKEFPNAYWIPTVIKFPDRIKK